MNFIAIDFETAHANIPCEIGITKVENGLITETHSWLIKPSCYPYMNPWNQQVHGISSKQLQNALPFDELWTEIRHYFEDQIVVAHNAAFDIKVLQSVLLYYDIAFPYFDYFCSVSLSRKAWKNLTSHSLGAMCSYHNITFNHHRAGDDAKACALISQYAFQELQILDIQEGLKRVGVKQKKMR